MFTASAELYDTIYSTFKDYAAEVDQIVALLGEEHPSCRTILDVACGTGEHARLLNGQGFLVDGIDLDENLVAVARRKNPGRNFFQADMCSFSIDRRYDAVLCLFSSIGYAKTLDRVVDALRCFRKHLTDGGVVVVEPWFTPGTLDQGRTTTMTVDAPPLRITRTSQLRIVKRVSELTFDYEITGPEGTSHAREHHELGLFTVHEMLDAFAQAGLAVSHDPKGLTGRGLYLGRVGRMPR
jgi:SAM-dependent methyltransferase